VTVLRRDGLDRWKPLKTGAQLARNWRVPFGPRAPSRTPASQTSTGRVAVPQTTIAFIDEAGSPEIPCLASKPGSLDEVFCVAQCFMGMHYWQELRQIYEQVRDDFDIPLDQELKWKNLF
jgi:hypothetical protein